MLKFKSILILFSLSILLGLYSNLAAQENSGGFAGSFSRMGFSPRGMAMGNAMSSVVQDGSYSYYNPALAALGSQSIQVDAAVSALQFDRQLNMAHAHFQLPPSAGFSISLLHSRVGNIDGRDQNGYHTEYLSTNEFQLNGSFGLRLSEKFWAGIGLKYNHARYHPEIPSASGLGIDLGILTKPLKKLRIGVSVQNLLASYQFNTSDLYGTDSSANIQEAFPIRILTGLSYELSPDWIVSLDVENRRHSYDFFPVDDSQNSLERPINRSESSSVSHFVRMGTGYRLHERFTLRAGIQLNDFTERNDFQPSAGFSIHLPYDALSPSIDYAFVQEPSGLSTMHVFAIRLNL